MAPEPTTADSIDATVRKAILERNELDVRLLGWAEALFEARQALMREECYRR